MFLVCLRPPFVKYHKMVRPNEETNILSQSTEAKHKAWNHPRSEINDICYTESKAYITPLIYNNISYFEMKKMSTEGFSKWKPIFLKCLAYFLRAKHQQ